MIEVVSNPTVSGSFKASGIIKKQEDFVCVMDLMLDVGRLDQVYDSQYRRELYSQMYHYSYPGIENGGENMDEYFDSTIDSVHTALKRAESGEDIRIWADSSPDGQCNLALICNLLLKVDGLGKVYIMRHPEYRIEEKKVIKCAGWGHFEQKTLSSYEDSCCELTKAEMEYYAETWENLVADNSLLRTVICGSVCSVSEDFYDEMIFECIPPVPIKESVIVGGFLKDFSFGVSSLLPVWRIDKMIKAGQVVVDTEATDGMRFLARKIKRAGV